MSEIHNQNQPRPKSKAKAMAKLKVFERPWLRQSLWHSQFGLMLGLVFAGCLLQIGGSERLLGIADTFAARLQFLLEVAVFFGVGATLTGNFFLLTENPKKPSDRR